ncbi:hypothetical protein KOI35_38075 [Actinoplanes bogorensis]|uniref:Uncharacterized protein n=1 Tax=Paractinoplanes bogorensis TaxID=1610840 RepID=A0ABS5Z1Y1_9ACTN|nr:hypothetical protein [Actinoplanes bogorensis]MBU2669336.1 hypothetical protein [Actinoplanes bogorensis]
MRNAGPPEPSGPEATRVLGAGPSDGTRPVIRDDLRPPAVVMRDGLRPPAVVMRDGLRPPAVAMRRPMRSLGAGTRRVAVPVGLAVRALFRAVAALVGAVADRLTPYAPGADMVSQRDWLLLHNITPPIDVPRRRRRYGGYGGAGAELAP